jgi:WD40 repeat protein
MTQANKTFRIFVSSTFSDLKAERNALQEHVFPQLRELCARHGCRFQAIDLRWGVRDEAALDQQTMKICLEEIARCQRTTPRPNFLVLLGDRYGWRPLPSEIPADEFDDILMNFAADHWRPQRELLAQWYRRDDNAVPPVFCLQPREGEFTDSDAWKAVERELRSVLVPAVEDVALTPEQRSKYIASATEQEITHGALQVTDAQQHVFCFFRAITDIPLDQSVAEFVDLDEDGNPDTEAQGLLRALKLRLSRALPGNVHEYETRWTGSGISSDHINKLCEDVLTSLSRVIGAEILRLEDVQPLDREIASQEGFGSERAKFFTGRAGILQTLSAYVRGDDPHPRGVFGESGSGKSALMARAVAQARTENSNAEMVVRFIGATPASSDGRALLESLCAEISRRYENDTTIPTHYSDLVQELPKRMAVARKEKPLIIWLDALDQLSDIERARNLIWLPAELPDNVRLIVSTLPGECLTALKKRLLPSNIVELESMSQSEGSGLLDLWLKDSGRTLQEDQREEVLSKFASNGLPLYLKLSFEEARRWKSYSLRVRLKGDVPGMVRDMFRRLSADHGQMLVSRSLGYLMAGKHGLTEDELLDVLARDEEFFEDFKAHAHHDLPEADTSQRRLPVVVWSRLYLDLEPYLTERSADGASLLAFYHRQLGEVVIQDYLGADAKQDRHRVLAEYFHQQPLLTEKEEQKFPNRRKLSELPYQQMHAWMWTGLERTLTDLDFVRAKFAATMELELISDYAAALETREALWPGRGRVEEFSRLVQSQASLFQTIPRLAFKKAILRPSTSAGGAARTFRVYVCSTFSDLKWERDALQRYVFPRLRELCAQHGCRFEPVDLRWGLGEEAARDHRTMSICLTEIERCQQTSPRPNFFVLLGDRFGWRPLPSEIPGDEFDRIRGIVDVTDSSLLDEWYRRDDNAVPPVYCLRPLTDRSVEWQHWAEVERRLRLVLLKAVESMDLSFDQQLKYAASALELEVARGAFQVPDAPEHVFCFFRRTSGLPHDQSARDFLDLDDSGTPDPECIARLAELKDRLRNRLRGNVYEYGSTWMGSDITTDHIGSLPESLDECVRLLDDEAPPTLCVDVWRGLARVIREEIARLQMVDPLEVDIGEHDAFGEDRSKSFLGRPAGLEIIANYLDSSDRHPLAVVGEPGSGKSALLARAIEQARAKLTSREVVARFIGATPSSTDGRALLESLCREISRRYALNEASVPIDYQELILDFRARLACATTEHPLEIFLDGLEDLRGNARQLAWLPDTLPDHVRFVVSVTRGEQVDALARRLPESSLLEIAPAIQSGADLLDPWMRNAGRTLQDHQRSEVLAKFEGCGMPLYLKLAFEEARHWRSYDVDFSLPPDIPGLIRNLFDRLTYEHGAALVSRSIAFLAAAKNGLSQEELLDVLSRDAEVFDEFKARSYHVPAEDRLPAVVWSRLFFDLKPYLAERAADGESLLTPFHRQLREAAEQVYLHEMDRVERHRLLAHYFGQQTLEIEQQGARVLSFRKLSELSYHQTYGEMWDELQSTLTDFHFIEAKYRAGMSYDLIDDYLRALERAPDSVRLEDFSRFVQNQSYIFRSYPELVFQQAINRPPDSAPYQIAQEQSHTISEPWIEWINKPQHEDPSRWTLIGHLGWINACAWAPDGTRVVSGSSDRKLKVWISRDGDEEATLTGHEGAINDCSWSPDCARILSASDDKSLKVWDAWTADEILTLRGHALPVRACAWSPDGRRILSCSSDGTLRIWDANDGRQLQTLVGHEREVNDCAWSPDGTRIVSASDDMTLKVWDADTGEVLVTLKGHTHYVIACGWSPDAQRIVSGSWDATLKIWDVATGAELKRLNGHSGAVKSCAWSPDAKRILSASSDKTLKVWDADLGKCRATLTGHGSYVNDCEWSPDMKQIVSGSCDLTLKIWDGWLAVGATTLSQHGEAVRSIAWSPDGEQIVSASEDSTLKIWNAETSAELSTFSGHSYWVSACDWSPGGGFIASASYDRTAKLWDARSSDQLATLEGHAHWVTACAWSPDGKLLATASYDASVRLWDADSAQERVSLSESSALETCAWSPDGTRLICAGWEGSVNIWDPFTATRVGSFRGHSGAVKSGAWSPDGRRVVSASQDGSLRIWDVVTGLERAVLSGHASDVQTCAWSPDGGYVLSGSADNTLMIWDASDGSIRATFIATGDVNSAATARGGSGVAIGDGAGVVYILRVHGIESRPPFVTPAFVWQAVDSSPAMRKWDSHPSVRCKLCGRRFIPPDVMLDAIRSINRSVSLAPGDSPGAKLPSEVWDDPRLRAECERCHQPVRFNPFIVDNRERY